MRPALLAPAMIAVSLFMAGCDQLGIESASAVAARREADGKAIGGACRHAGRAIEDCYVLNKRADRAAIYAGWREMNEYMRENKLEPVTPQIQPETHVAAAKGADAAESDEKPAHGHGDKAPADKGEKADKPEKADDKAAKSADRRRRSPP